MTFFFGFFCGSNAVLAALEFPLNEPRWAWLNVACAIGALACGVISSRERKGDA